MSRVLTLAGLLMLAASPAWAISPSWTSVTCAGAVTTGQGTHQTVRDLKPSELPVLAYSMKPAEREFKQLAVFGDVPVRLYVYRVNENLLRLRIYEDGATGEDLLADTDLSGEVTQLSYRVLGGDEMVTAYCY